MNDIKTLRLMFIPPITAMAATIKPTHLIHLKTSVLRTSVVIKGNIDRPKVEIHILPYFFRKKIETDEKRKPVAVQIEDLVNGKSLYFIASMPKNARTCILILSHLALILLVTPEVRLLQKIR
jgi:hypothetical protein